MEKYNLLGQRGIAGERNPDPNLTDDVATYMYDFPPGQGDNKGATSTNKPVAKKEVEEKKVEVALENPNSYIARNPNISVKVEEKKEELKLPERDIAPGVTPLAERVITTQVPVKAFDVIEKEINTINDLQNYGGAVNFTSSQKFYLATKLNIPIREIDNIIDQKLTGPQQSEANPIAQLQFETDYIKTFVDNRKKILEEQEAGRDTRSLEQKETDYIKTFVETGVLGKVDFKQDIETLIPTFASDINYQEQINKETEAIKKLVNNVVEDGIKNNKSNNEIVNNILNESQTIQSQQEQQIVQNQIEQLPVGGITQAELNNVPKGAYVWEVSGQLYLAYEVPGAGDIYQGAPIFMAYAVAGNDLVQAGLITEGGPLPSITPLNEDLFNATTIVFGGDTNQLTSLIDNPFVGFVESVSDQLVIAPWIGDQEMIGLVAEAALEGRTVTDAELKGTNWWRTHNEAEREYLETYYGDPATSAQQRTDAEISVANTLQAQGVSNAPEALINWIAGQYVTGKWSQAYTSEQIALFADPYATGKRDASLENYLSSTALTGVDRTTEREREVRELYAKWLGPTLGKLTDNETAEIAGKLRDDPDYEDALIQSLKQSRLAAFSNYTNPELTYEDIARPWRNLTTSVWGQTADETQGWWQEMMKSNDFAKAQTTLREKGLEQDVTQVTQDATKALQQALGQGTISQSGVNV